MAEQVKESIQRKLRYLKDQVLVDVVEGGVRIQIIDLEGSMMFPSGSDVPTEKAVRILELVAENIRDTDNKIAIEGHTDCQTLYGGKDHKLGAVNLSRFRCPPYTRKKWDRP